MNKLRSTAATALLALSLSAGLYGCGGPEPTPTVVPTPTLPPPTATSVPPTDTPAPPSPTTAPTVAIQSTPTTAATSGGMTITGPAADLLVKSAAAMKAATSYHFAITTTVSGAAGGQAVGGEGDFQAPDKRRMVMQITPQGATEIITIGNDVYFKMPGSESYMSLGGAANPMANLGSASATQDVSAFARSMESAEIVGDEQVDGVDTTHIKFTYDVDKAVAATTPTSASTPAPASSGSLGKADGEMWIEKSTGYVRKMTISSAVPDSAAGQGTPTTGGTSVVQATYSKFNEPVNPAIEKPANVVGPGGLPLTTPTP